MSTVIYINFYSSSNTASAPWTYNAYGSGSVGVGTLTADLKDDANASTGISLDVINAFTGATGGSTVATSGAGGWPEEVFDQYWYQGAAQNPAKLRLGNLTNGDSYSIELAGHQGTLGARDTDYTIGATTTRYDNSGTATPNAPITISGTVSGTTLDIDQNLVDTFGYLNGAKITITPSGFAIDTEPTESRANVAGSFTISGPATAPTTGNTSIKLVDGSGPAATIDSVTGSDPYVINYTFPTSTNKLFNSTGYAHYIAVDAENATSSVIPYLPETNWDFVTLGTPDTGTDIYLDYAGGTWVTGDQAVWDTTSDPSSAAVTIDNTLNWEILPAPTVNQTVGIYRISAAGTKDVDDTISFSIEDWALQLDGVDDRLSFTLWQETGDFTISGEIDILGTPGSWLSSTSNDVIEEKSGGEALIRLASGTVQNIPLLGLTGRTKFSVSRSGTLVSYDFGEGTVTGSFTQAGTVNFSKIGARGGTSVFYGGRFYGELKLDGATAGTITYNMNTNDHSPGVVVLEDTTGTKDATAVNMVTDGTAWIDLTPVATIPSTNRGSISLIGNYLLSTGDYNSIQINDVIKEWLVGEGYTGALNQMLYNYLGANGYAGTLQDRMIKWSRDV